jgi:hypothetical protein
VTTEVVEGENTEQEESLPWSVDVVVVF